MKTLFFLACVLAVGCHNYQPCGIDPNCGRHNYYTTFVAPSGQPAHHVYCDGSDMCDQLNGQACPHGYAFISGESSHHTDDIVECKQ